RTRIRVLPWAMWVEQIPGTLAWWSITNIAGTDDPWGVASDKDRQRASQLIRPPRPESADRSPLDSVRWELFQLAHEEAEQLAKLERLASRRGVDLAVLTDINESLGTLPRVGLWRDQDTYQADPQLY